MKIEMPRDKYDNLTSKERADKGSPLFVWDREDYIKEAEKQLGDSDVYEEIPDDPEPLISTIHRTI